MPAFFGTRIVDFSQGIAGPMATMLFADFEADVIKVEPPDGDRLKDHAGYLAWNRNKRRIRLDLSRWEGRRDAHRLIATADVAVFDGRPGELEALGLDAVTLCAAHPRLLHVTLPPFGLHGRWSQLPPNDDLIHALSAVAFLQHTYSGVPVQLVTPQVAYAHATIAANAIAAGLLERSRSGQGQAVTVSGLHAVASVESGGAIRGTTPVMRLGTGSSRGSAPNYRLYRCADDQWFFLGTLTPQFFLKALEAIGMMDLLTLPGIDGEFANLLNPATNGVVKQALDVRFAEKTREEWLAILHAADVPCAPVGRREEWFLDEPVAIEWPSL